MHIAFIFTMTHLGFLFLSPCRTYIHCPRRLLEPTLSDIEPTNEDIKVALDN